MVEEKVDINCEPSVGLNFIAAVQSAQAWILAVRETLPFHDCPWRALFLPQTPFRVEQKTAIKSFPSVSGTVLRNRRYSDLLTI